MKTPFAPEGSGMKPSSPPMPGTQMPKMSAGNSTAQHTLRQYRPAALARYRASDARYRASDVERLVPGPLHLILFLVWMSYFEDFDIA
eukprot:3940705-Rhodomonas_salina.2